MLIGIFWIALYYFDNGDDNGEGGGDDDDDDPNISFNFISSLYSWFQWMSG